MPKVIQIPVGKIFPSDRFEVVEKNGVVSALPKGAHEYLVDGKPVAREGTFPHVTMVPYDATALEEAQKNAGKPDFVLPCAEYHVTDQGERRIWRRFEEPNPGNIVVRPGNNQDSNIAIEHIMQLQNRFLNALGNQIGSDIGGA